MPVRARSRASSSRDEALAVHARGRAARRRAASQPARMSRAGARLERRVVGERARRCARARAGSGSSSPRSGAQRRRGRRRPAPRAPPPPSSSAAARPSRSRGVDARRRQAGGEALEVADRAEQSAERVAPARARAAALRPRRAARRSRAMSVSGASSHCRSSRPPIGVRVSSSTHEQRAAPLAARASRAARGSRMYRNTTDSAPGDFIPPNTGFYQDTCQSSIKV